MGLFGSGGQLTKSERQTIGQNAFMKLESNDKSGASDLLEPHIGPDSRHKNKAFCTLLNRHKINMSHLRRIGSDYESLSESNKITKDFKKFLIEFIQ